MNHKMHHRMVVGCMIKNKLQEYEYFLIKVLTICESAERNFNAGTNHPDSDAELNFLFNAFINTYQSLKDSLETATGKKSSGDVLKMSKGHSSSKDVGMQLPTME